MSHHNGKKLEFKSSHDPLIIGQLFHVEGLSVTAKLTCRCSHRNQPIEIPQGYVGRCQSCRRGFRNHGLQSVNGQLGCAIEPMPPDATERSGRGRGLLRWSPEIVLELVKGGRPARLEVVGDPIPADATLVNVSASENLLVIEIESAALPAGESPTVLPAPMMKTVTSDERIVHDAGRLRAALLTSSDAPQFADLLDETVQYAAPPFARQGAVDG